MPKLIIPKNLITNFKRRGLRKYPVEYIETLWGTVSSNGNVEISETQILDHEATRDSCAFVHDEVQFGIKDIETDLIQVGTIHTHPWPEKLSTDGTKWLADCSPSEIDWELLKSCPMYVMGVMTILPRKIRRVTRVKFYVGAAPFEVEEID